MLPSTPAPPWRTYLRWMLATLLGLLTGVGAFNVLIDPHGVFDSPRIPGLNALKPSLDHHRELARWRAARRLCLDTGIFGNSRAAIGFDPENPEFAKHGLQAFNHAIPGSGPLLSYRQLNWLQGSCMPKTLIIGVDFFDFLGGTQAATLPSPESDSPPALDASFATQTIFSLTGLRDALNTIQLQHARHPATLTAQGFTPLDNYLDEVAQSGHHVLFRQRAMENLRMWKRLAPRLLGADGGISAEQQQIEAILARATAAGSTVHLVIYPYHAEIRLLIERTGLGQLYADWKRMIVASAAHTPDSETRVRVWDFSGISPETLEAIPASGDRHTHMQYYWEAGHFKKALGDKLLARLLTGAPGFGIELRAPMLEKWLQEDRSQVQALLATPSPLLTEVDLLVAGSQRK